MSDRTSLPIAGDDSTEPLRAITVRQPWASLIAAGVKTIETRPRRTAYRGPVAIHAGAKGPEHESRVGRWTVYYPNSPGHLWHPGREALLLPLGSIVAVANLVDCLPIVDVIGAEHQEGAYVEAGGTYLSVWHPGAPVTERIDEQIPFGDFSPGRFALLLEDVYCLPEPVPATGKQAVPWVAPDDVAAAVREQLLGVSDSENTQ